MFCQNLHAHSTYDDGKSTIREMVMASRDAGLSSVGISVHAPLGYDSGWNIDPLRMDAYMAEVAAVRQEFEKEIDVFTGIEWDVLYADIDLKRFDYVIGSVHHIPSGNPPSCVDEKAETTLHVLETYYGGDRDAMAEAYFAQYDAVASQPQVDIVGHVDLITKFDEKACIFTPCSRRYMSAALSAMEKLVRAGKIFEINTGAISRGMRTTPYPDRLLLCALREMGGRITISADAHHVSGVTCAYDQAVRLAMDCGFKEAQVLCRHDSDLQFLPVTLQG